MKTSPIARSVTQRMLRSAVKSGAKTTDKYLQAFGITDVSLNKLPSVFDPSFAPEWKAFLNANPNLNGGPAERALRATLSFVRYCQSLKLDPFSPSFRFRDPIAGSSKINPAKIQQEIAKQELSVTFKAIKDFVQRLRIMQYMRLYKTKVTTTGPADRPKMVAVYALDAANKRMPLDAILANLNGLLFSGMVPPQLKPILATAAKGAKTVDKRPPCDTMMTGLGTVGWFPVTRNPNFDLFAIRAKNGILVIKIIIPLMPESDTDGVTSKQRVAMWSKLKPFST